MKESGRKPIVLSAFSLAGVFVIALSGWLLSNRPYYWRWSSEMEDVLPEVIVLGVSFPIYAIGPLLSFMVAVSSGILLAGLVALLRSKGSVKVMRSVGAIFVVVALLFQIMGLFVPWLYARPGPNILFPGLYPRYWWNGWFYPWQVIQITSHGVFVSSFQDYWFTYSGIVTTALGWLGVFALQISTVVAATIASVTQRLRRIPRCTLGASVVSLSTMLLGTYQYYVQKELNGSLLIEPSIGFVKVIISTILLCGAYLIRKEICSGENVP